MRHEVKRRRLAVQKLDLLQEIEKEVPEDMTQLTEGARNFVQVQLNPIMGCLRNHFSGDQEAFSAQWKKLSPTSFSKNNCSGKGNTCKPRVKKSGK